MTDEYKNTLFKSMCELNDQDLSELILTAIDAAKLRQMAVLIDTRPAHVKTLMRVKLVLLGLQVFSKYMIACCLFILGAILAGADPTMWTWGMAVIVSLGITVSKISMFDAIKPRADSEKE